MILDCKGLKIRSYKIPKFELREGEIIGLCLYGGSHYSELRNDLIKLFSGEINHENIRITYPLEYVENLNQFGIWDRIFPITVKKYLKKNTGEYQEFVDKVYNIDYVTPNTRINNLAGNSRKWLSLYTTFSRTNKIVFDLLGQDLLGAEKTLTLVKENIGKGGGAILLDNFNEPHEIFDNYLKIEV